ncbi:hypothetical protein GOP47_0000700 [Adiantum capillus-veneris]|uniref:Ran guanine nucleotide release factor n=1 Tax=Adiantum capillus-veneris TaxID=13818 RepID=A0A9D4VF82_ADICA|nr:hypothetical protein GOP47_0000700 [Adiantum capillus-veneris]
MNDTSPRALFNGAISCSFPSRLQDVSSIRDVPDNQEIYADPSRDESIIVEILEHEGSVADAQSAVWFLQDLSHEQDAGQSLVLEDVKELTLADTPLLGSQYVVNAAVGRMAVSKGRQGAEAQNLLRVYLANIRLPNVNTDILVTVNEPLLISEESESAKVVGAGVAVSAEAAGVMPASEIFHLVLATFKINDWGLFGN